MIDTFKCAAAALVAKALVTVEFAMLRRPSRHLLPRKRDCPSHGSHSITPKPVLLDKTGNNTQQRARLVVQGIPRNMLDVALCTNVRLSTCQHLATPANIS